MPILQRFLAIDPVMANHVTGRALVLRPRGIAGSPDFACDPPTIGHNSRPGGKLRVSIDLVFIARDFPQKNCWTRNCCGQEFFGNPRRSQAS